MQKNRMKRAGKSRARNDFQGTTPYQAGSYFPDTRVAANGTSFVSPTSYASPRGQTGNTPSDIISLPRGGESPWIVPVQSDEQGVGRSPGQQWPAREHSEQYNLSQIDIMPFEFDQTFVSGFPDYRTGKPWRGREHPEKYGWSTPRFYEEYLPWASGDTGPDSVAVTADPQNAAWSLAQNPLDDGSQAYG